MDTADAGDKMILPRPDCFFCGIGAVVMRGDQLEGDFLLGHEGGELGWALVVEEGDLGGEAAIDEEGVDGGEGFGEFAVAAVFEAAGEDTVGVGDVTRHDILGAVAGGLGESPHLVGCYLAGDLQGLEMDVALLDRGGRHVSNGAFR